MWKPVYLIIGLLSIFFITSPATAEQSEAEILSHSSYTDPFGNYHIVGEVENVGNFSLTSFTVTAKFYDSEGVLIDDDFAYLMWRFSLEILPPGYKAPFHIVYVNTEQVPEIHSYTIEIHYDQISKIPLIKLDVKTQESYVDEDGWMHITGTIKNNGADTRFVEVIATCYDENGNVTCVEYSFTNPRDIQSGQTGSFEILIPYRVDLIKDYVLLLQSEDYVSINEFPSKTLFTIFTLAVILSYTAFHFKNTEKPPEKKVK